MDLMEWTDAMCKGAYPSREVPDPLYGPMSAALPNGNSAATIVGQNKDVDADVELRSVRYGECSFGTPESHINQRRGEKAQPGRGAVAEWPFRR